MIFQFYKNDDSAVQALLKGEVDFVEGITALEVKSLQGKPGITAHNGNSPGFDEIAFNAGSVSTSRATRSATPTRPCWTRSSGTRWATRSTCRS